MAVTRSFFIRVALTGLLSASMTACTSLHERAEKHFNNKEYVAAAATYEEILRDKPGDAVALEKLRRTRQALIEERLIEVRQLRLANNFADALAHLHAIVDDEARWQVSPTGAAFATQTEETELLFNWLAAQARVDAAKGKFLRAALSVDQHFVIFAQSALRIRCEKLIRELQTMGGEHCLKLERLAGASAFARDFVNRYCVYWGQSVDARTHRRSLPSFGSVQFKGEIKGLRSDGLTTLSDALLEALKDTPYFHPSARPLTVNLAGRFNSSYSEQTYIAIHSYQVKIPYQVMETVYYTENEPYTETVEVTNPMTGEKMKIGQTAYRLVAKTRQEARTHFRQEARSQSYPATEFRLHYLLMGKAEITLDSVQYLVPLNAEMNLTDSYHETENREIGLLAKKKDMPSEMKWLNEHFGSARTRFAEMVARAWDARYCKLPPKLDERGQMEAVMRCVAGTRLSHDFVENWFQAKFGLTYARVRQVLGAG